MNSKTLLFHHDAGTCWPHALSAQVGYDLDAAYADALAVRALRLARGEQAKGYKIGFTNRTIWPRYNVFHPIWGTVWHTTLSFCEDEKTVSLAGVCQPRLEPEMVFGFQHTPPAHASVSEIFASLAWIAPGFEIVQSHLSDWKFEVADTVADGGLHAHLVVGAQIPVASLAREADDLHAALAKATVTLCKGAQEVEVGLGRHVLDSPLHALAHFLNALRACAGAPDIQAGDVVTTGTWTDAYPIQAGEVWQARFDWPQTALTVRFE